MKTSRTLKKPILLVLAAILTVAVIASVAVTFAFADGANNATLDGYQVTMNGSIGLRFYYSALGNVTEFKAQVGENDPVSYAIPEGETGARIDVALAPSQMAETVKVWPVYADTTTGTVTEYSVAEYAQYVIANDTKGQANVMRALLNWGNAANEKFADGASKIEDIFARGTNPINAVGNISFTAHDQGTTGDVGGFSGGEANLVLAPEDIQLKFSFKYVGEGNLTANISRPAVGDIEALDKDVELSTDGNGNYFFYVKKVSINLFNALYTLTVNDGTDTYKKQISVLEYLNAISTNTDGTYDAPTKSTAKALYQFYQQGTGSVASCAHNSGKTFYASKDATTDSLKCAVCSATIKDMPKTATAYVTPDMMLNYQGAAWIDTKDHLKGTYIHEEYKWNASSRYNMADIKVASDETNPSNPYFTFTVGGGNKVSQFLWNRDVAAHQGYNTETQKYGDKACTYPNENYVSNVGKAKYLVIRTRISDASAPCKIVISTVGTSNGIDQDALLAETNAPDAMAGSFNQGKYGDPRITVTIPASTEWVTYVVDLSLAANDGKLAYQPSADGTYDIDTFYFEVGNASGQKFDVEYFAFAEDWAAIDAIVDEATVTSVISADGKSNAKVNVSSAKCEGAHSEDDVIVKNNDGSSTIYDKCVYCTETISSKTLPASITKLWTARQYNTTAKLYFNNNGKLLHTLGSEDNMKYAHLAIEFNEGKTSGAAQVIFNRTAADAGSNNVDPFSVGQAKYLVVKARTNRTNINSQFHVSTAAVDGKGSIILPFKVQGADKWTTFVIDLSLFKGKVNNVDNQSVYVANGDGTYTIDTFYTHIESVTATDILDIAYVGFVAGDWTDIDALVDETTVVKVTGSNEGYVVNTVDGECPAHTINANSYSVTNTEEVGDRTYKFTCTSCGETIDERSVASSVTAYISPYHIGKTDNSRDTFVKALHTQSYFMVNGNKWDYDATEKTAFFTYDHQDKSEGAAVDTYTQIFWSRAKDNSGWGAQIPTLNVGAAKYLVLKVRTDHAGYLQITLRAKGETNNTPIKIPFSVSPSYDQYPSAYSGSGNHTTGWTTYVVNLSTLIPGYPSEGNLEFDNFWLYTSNTAGDKMKIDISYIAFVSGGWTEIDTLVDDDTVVNVTGSNVGILVNAKDGKCVEHNAFGDTTVQNGNYVAVCADCGYVRDYGVTTESANTFLAGNNLKDFGGSVCTYSVTEMNENGESFVRFNNFATTSTTAGWYGVTLQDHNGVGKYMVIKMRIGDNGLNQTAMKMYTSTIDNELKNETQAVTMKISEDGEWYIYVIDLSTRVSACEPDADGVYTSKFLQIRPFTGAQVTVTAYKTNEAGKYVDKDGKELADQSNPANGGVASSYATKPAADDYFDIAYIAYCDDLADVSGITGDEGYLVSTGNNTNVAYNADGTPVEAQ